MTFPLVRGTNWIKYGLPDYLKMESAKLMGKDWLDAQRVEYKLIPVASMTPYDVCTQLGIIPGQIVVCELYIGKKEPVLVVRESTTRVDFNALALHMKDAPFRPATPEEVRAHTRQEPPFLHPFIEGYLWKVLDEKIFDHEKIYLPIGKKNTLLCMDSSALKYSVGVINGLIADITEKR